MIYGIVIAAALVGGVGLILGLFLGVAGKKFEVEVDEREVRIREELPGNNCGGCGYAGCDAMAKAIAAGEAPVNGCPVGGGPVAAKIGAIMGQSVEEGVRRVAYVKCAGTCDQTKRNFTYTGEQDCEMMAFIPGGGPKACDKGCMGFGSCVKACPFDAIHVINGVAFVDREACRACGKCVAVCPRHLIELIPYDQKIMVQCSYASKDKKTMRAICEAGCLGCKRCEKACEKGAVKVENFVAHINPELCEGCGACMEVCSRKIIREVQ